MKIFITGLVFICMYSCCKSQSLELTDFNKERIKLTKQSMLVLGSWSAANLIFSGASAGSAEGSNKYFHQMNTIWGGINITLAAIGYLGAKNQDGLSFAKSLQKQSSLEKTFLFNTGLDIAYIAGGFYLKEKAYNDLKNKDRYKGFGNSIVLQGSALFLFDGIMYLLHQQHGKKINKFFEKFQLTTTPNGLGCIVKI